MTAEEQSGELNFVVIGPAQKSILLEKLFKAASHYERHVHYQDVHYVTVDYDGAKHVVEINDQGIERTGGREMAIKNADLVVLYYSAFSMQSLTQLKSVKDDLERRKGVPICLICDTDEARDDDDNGSTVISSASEGYESDYDQTTSAPRMRRHGSMEKIRKALEDGDPSGTGESIAADLPNCTFIKLSSSSYEDSASLLEDWVRKVKTTDRRGRSKTSISEKIAMFRARSKSRDAANQRKKSSQKSASVKSRSNTVSAEDVPERKKSNGSNKDSKVCSIM